MSIDPDLAVVGPDLVLLERITDVRSATVVALSSHARTFKVVDAAGNVFAVKLVHPSTTARAVRLATALGGDGAANPVLLHGVLEPGGVGYLVHPWWPGRLADLVPPLPAARAAEVLDDAAQAVEILHRIGYVHGDLKPANLLLDHAGRAVVGDLDEATPSGTVRPRWTPGWAAPEVRDGEAAGPGADRWGFALVVAVLVGGPQLALAAGAPDFRADLAAALPGPLAQALAADLDPDPRRRDVPTTSLIRILRGVALESRRPAVPPSAAGTPTAEAHRAVKPAVTPREHRPARSVPAPDHSGSPSGGAPGVARTGLPRPPMRGARRDDAPAQPAAAPTLPPRTADASAPVPVAVSVPPAPGEGLGAFLDAVTVDRAPLLASPLVWDPLAEPEGLPRRRSWTPALVAACGVALAVVGAVWALV